MGSLTALFVKSVAEGRGDPGKYHDGGGLMLRVRPGGTSGWVFRWQRDGQRREMGLGTPQSVTLAKARELADDARRLVATGGDPLDKRHEARAEKSRQKTFDEASAAFIEAHEPSWKNDKHRAQWKSTLETYASPKIGGSAVAKIGTPEVLSVLRPIWTLKPETASRVRGRIEVILDWAKAQNLRDGDNPARWRGHLSLMLPAKGKVHKVKHHAAVPIDDLPDVFKELGESPGIAAAAVQFGILCASRPGEVVGAAWDEIDTEAKVWTIPPQRMKREREHRVPLSDAALTILARMKAIRVDEAPLVFPGAKKDRPLSLASLSKALRVAGGGVATVHGSARSTFDDWATERTSHPSKLVDRALAHVEGNATVAAYRRTDLLEQRRSLMADWSAFLND